MVCLYPAAVYCVCVSWGGRGSTWWEGTLTLFLWTLERGLYALPGDETEKCLDAHR